MAVDIAIMRSRKPAGRPLIAAVFSSSNDKAIEKREIFFKLCRSLSYSDKVHIANGLAVTFRTVENWYYGCNLPDEQIREDIIDWYAKGKPVKKILQ